MLRNYLTSKEDFCSKESVSQSDSDCNVKIPASKTKATALTLKEKNKLFREKLPLPRHEDVSCA
jgi:hypothetical protein